MSDNENGLQLDSFKMVPMNAPPTIVYSPPKPFDICSPTFSTLMTALVKAKSNFKFIGKTANNPHYKSKHATLDVVYSSVQPALLEQGLFISCGVTGTDNTPITVKLKNEPVLHFVRNFRVTVCHENGEYIGTEIPIYINPNDPQKTGISFTYLQRYAIAALLSLVIEDDDDGNAASGVNAYTMTITEAQANNLRKEIKTGKNPNGKVLGDDVTELLTKYGCEKLAEIPKSKYDEFKSEFDALKTKPVEPTQNVEKPVEKVVTNPTLEKVDVRIDKIDKVINLIDEVLLDEFPTPVEKEVVTPEEAEEITIKFIDSKKVKELQTKRETDNWDVTKVKETLEKFGITGGYKNIPLDKCDEIVTELEKLKGTKTDTE